MKSIIFKKIIADEYKPILSNFFSLGLIQGSNFLLAIVTFPYLVRTIGIENFGIITFVQSIMIYFTVFTDYGFNLSATKDISINRKNNGQLSKIFSEVISTKLILTFTSLIALIAAFLLFPHLKDYWVLTIYSFTLVLGQVMQPIWFFQGVEKMKYITYSNILIRGLYAFFIFIFIKNADDFLYVNLISGIASIVGGVISLFILFIKFKIRYYVPNVNAIKRQLQYSWNIFFSNVSVTIANNSNIVILGFFTNSLVLGYYSIAEKVFLILRTFAVILYQVVYPRICILATESFSNLSFFLNKIFKLIIVTFLPLSITVFILSDYIIYLMAGDYIYEAALVLKIICFGPLMAALNIPVAQTMLAYHLSKKFAFIVSIGAILNLISNLILAYHYGAIGTACSIIITEIAITALLYIYIHKHYPQYSFFSSNKLAQKIDIKINSAEVK